MEMKDDGRRVLQVFGPDGATTREDERRKSFLYVKAFKNNGKVKFWIVHIVDGVEWQRINLKYVSSIIWAQ